MLPSPSSSSSKDDKINKNFEQHLSNTVYLSRELHGTNGDYIRYHVDKVGAKKPGLEFQNES